MIATKVALPGAGATAWQDDPEEAVQAVQARFQAWARQSPAKTLARALDIPIKTVERWQAEDIMPRPDRMAHLVGHLGEDWLTWIYGPVIGETDLDARLASLTTQIEGIRRDLREGRCDSGQTGPVGASGPAADVAVAVVAADAGAEDGGAAPGMLRTSRHTGTTVVSALLIGLTLGVAVAQAWGDADPWARARAPRPSVRIIRLVKTTGGRDV